MDFLKNLSDKPHPEEQQAPQHGGGLMDKLSDALDGGSHHQKPQPQPQPQTRSESGGLMDKIGSVFEGHHPPPPPPPQKHEDGGLLGKLTGALEGHHPPAPPPQKHEDEGLLGKLTGALEGHNKPAQEGSGSGGLMGKVNSALGGGHKGEKNEDPLDKAVDFFQEHVLHEGSQKNESAIEQLKDEGISDTIRRQYKNMTGKEFPIEDKK